MATTTCGTPVARARTGRLERILVAAVDGRGCQPSTAKRAAIPPGQPCVGDRLSITTAVRLSRPSAPGERRWPRGWCPRRARASPTRHDDPRPVRPAARRPSASADRQRQSVTQRAATRSRRRAPGCGPGGCRAASRTSPRPSSHDRVDEALGGQARRSRPSGRGPSRAGSGRGPGRRTRSGATSSTGRTAPRARRACDTRPGSCFSSPVIRARSAWSGRRIAVMSLDRCNLKFTSSQANGGQMAESAEDEASATHCRRTHDRRAVGAQRGGHLGAALLRVAGPDPVAAHGRQPAALPPGRAAPGGIRARRPAGRAVAGGDRARPSARCRRPGRRPRPTGSGSRAAGGPGWTTRSPGWRRCATA